MEVTRKFNISFRWNLFGSLSFELLKILYHFFLMQILTPNKFGVMVSIYSITYMTIYFSDFAATTALPPFLGYMIQSKNNFKNLFLFYSFPQIPLLIFSGLVATFFYMKSIFYQSISPFLFIIPIMIFIEGIRIFLRTFLHYIFYSKMVIIFESSFTVLYYIFIVLLYFIGLEISLNIIFIPFLISSFFSIFVFCILIYKFYCSLPNKVVNIPTNIRGRIIRGRLVTFPNQIIKTFFTGNFLTPIFASYIGVSAAGILKFTSMIADSIKAVIKACIGFSGNALLSTSKESARNIKIKFFDILSKKLNNIIYFILIFLLINYKNLISFRISTDKIAQTTLIFSLIFLLIVIAEHFFIVYEQFYILEEKADRFLIFKLFELVLFYLFVLTKFASPIKTLFSILFIQLLSFIILMIHAYYNWSIKTDIRPKPIYIAISFLFSLGFWSLCKFL